LCVWCISIWESPTALSLGGVSRCYHVIHWTFLSNHFITSKLVSFSCTNDYMPSVVFFTSRASCISPLHIFHTFGHISYVFVIFVICVCHVWCFNTLAYMYLIFGCISCLGVYLTHVVHLPYVKTHLPIVKTLICQVRKTQVPISMSITSTNGFPYIMTFYTCYPLRPVALLNSQAKSGI
jgi:hypothetical protein